MKQLQIDYFQEPINLEVGYFYNFVVENIVLFRKIYWSLFTEFEFDDIPIKILDDNNFQAHFDELCCPITNILNTDLNSKKNLNILNKIFKKTYYGSLDDDIVSLKNKAKEIVNNISLDLDIPIAVNNDISTDDLFKLFNVRFIDEKENLLESFINFVKVTSELQQKNIFIVVHLKEFFTKNELETLIKETSYRQIIFINIETNNLGEKITDEKTIIIDKDYCVLN